MASDLEEFKKFVTEELFSLKTCVQTVRNSGADQICETTDKQKSLNRRQDQQEKYQQYHNVNKRRPSPVINQYPENQTTFAKATPQPEPKSYSGTVKSIKKVVLSDSIPKLLSLYYIKKKLRHSEIYKKCFPGVNTNHLKLHIIPTLSEDKPDTVIIHVGVDDMMNGTDRDGLILQIGRIGFTCKNYGVKNVIISGLVYTRRIKNNVVDYVNKKLQELCNYQSCKFINNSNIQLEHLCKNGLHLDLNGKKLLFENCLNFLGDLLCQVQST